MAYYAYGAGPASSLVSMTYHLINFTRDNFHCAAFQRLLLSCRTSFLRKIAEIETEAKEPKHGKTTVRSDVALRYARSFDLFNFGVLCAHVACSIQSGKTATALMGLARRLTHYDAVDFTQDAREAHRWLQNELR